MAFTTYTLTRVRCDYPGCTAMSPEFSSIRALLDWHRDHNWAHHFQKHADPTLALFVELCPKHRR